MFRKPWPPATRTRTSNGVAGQVALPHSHRTLDLLAPAVVANEKFVFDFSGHVAILSEELKAAW